MELIVSAYQVITIMELIMTVNLALIIVLIARMAQFVTLALILTGIFFLIVSVFQVTIIRE